MTIELRLTDVDPPTAEPARTIYHDIASLPDPVIQGISIRYFNYDDVSLYFKISGTGTGYTSTPVNLGLLASGANVYKNLDQFFSRARPTAAQLPNGEMMENVVLKLEAYTDAGYTILKWTFNRTVTVIWLNSGDAAFTLTMLNNFDDGTVDGWAGTNYGLGNWSFAIASDYVLSVPYSLKDTYSGIHSGSDPFEFYHEFHKSITTPAAKTENYAIIDIRLGSTETNYPKNIQVLNGSTLLLRVGQPYDTVASAYVPDARWLRIVVPLPVNTTFTLSIYIEKYIILAGSYADSAWLDDFKVISK